MTSGFAVRKNGSCLRTETDCGETVGGFRGCCPGGTFCPIAYNIDCCPSGENCTESLVKEPRCANATWDLYDNGGYFCCPHDTIGFALAGQTDGCAGTGYSFGERDTRLEVISSGTVLPFPSTATTSETSTSTATSATTTSAAATQTSSSSSSSSGVDKGAVAGGVIGGVAGVALIAAFVWLFMRRRSRPQPAPMQGGNAPIHDYKYISNQPVEVDGQGYRYELESRHDAPAHELPAQLPGR
ncbi:hypothetical protein ANOM_004316 [Aspergillus nomiae NRRL 13137]|uniref:Uncharacterized protein n=1 Tax=Aspergillus nomiae NRRL (strain ATCC 15546 / NRRL 13137 / CBS 260.88 / M93) TaxID=1509407 RepID=A0A0L1J9C3_ASPN3|nr:uncharacterized protein ANOM_004316 [Aspergillus nomiae NRRL 13137]KNG88406.1 hypothetical protein ANOM_004316 [Aspergillus nomiae NRRL 13137]